MVLLKLAFTVLGKAQPAGSKKAFALRKGGVLTGAAAVVDANPKAKSWQQEVRSVANQARIDAGCIPFVDLLDGPLGMRVRIYTARPKSHYRTGRNASLLRPAAPAYPITRPDSLKLLRGLEDALTGTIYRDDAQLVVHDVRKLYGEPARTEVEVWAIEP